MLDTLVVGIVCLGLIFAGYMTWQGRAHGGGFFAIVVATVIAGVAVANLPRISEIAVQVGATTSINLKLQEARETVAEAQRIKERVEVLARRVEQGEQNVSCMGDTMRETWRALFEAIEYILMTRDIHIPRPINETITRDLFMLAALGYPNEEERHNVVQQLLANVRKAHEQETTAK